MPQCPAAARRRLCQLFPPLHLARACRSVPTLPLPGQHDVLSFCVNCLNRACRENDRATLVGGRTFGKGVIQTVEPLTTGGGVAVTVAR